MVKLATAREARLYGPALAARRWEYINAGVYVFAALLLVLASAVLALASSSAASARAGLAAAAVALAAMAAVNAHDLAAHLAGVDCRVGLARYDPQLGLVELLVPPVHAAGCALAVAALALLLSQHQHQPLLSRREAHAATMLLAAALLWVVGCVLNACQVYERADARAQLLQAGVQVPQLLGSLLLLVAAALDRRRVIASGTGSGGGGGEDAVAWLVLAGSVLWLAAALVNVLKVFTMHQSDALRLEKLRGGAQEPLSRDREGRVPLHWDWEDAARRRALPTELR